LAQDDYYYEIQLTNKQLVFYFMAGAAGLILSFLAGVMVGRGVDSSAGDVRAARPVAEERIVPEEPPATKPAPPPAEDLTYAQRLEGDKVDDSLKPAGSGAPPAPKGTPAPPPKGAADASKATAGPARTVAPKPAPSPSARAAAKPSPAAPATGAASFTIQVGAFKDKATAESVVTRLKDKGFAAYVVSPEGADGLFNVRVGSYPARADAERIQTRLRDEEKFKPFIVRN
jgi:cell division septation protein DedD